jgi:hypothetical protein
MVMTLVTARDPAARLQHALITRLKLRQLALLQAVDRHRTLGRVAAEMRVSQPAVTKALREVEDIFGNTLFERTSRGLVPTAPGAGWQSWSRPRRCSPHWKLVAPGASAWGSRSKCRRSC